MAAGRKRPGSRPYQWDRDCLSRFVAACKSSRGFRALRRYLLLPGRDGGHFWVMAPRSVDIWDFAEQKAIDQPAYTRDLFPEAVLEEVMRLREVCRKYPAVHKILNAERATLPKWWEVNDPDHPTTCEGRAITPRIQARLKEMRHHPPPSTSRIPAEDVQLAKLSLLTLSLFGRSPLSKGGLRAWYRRLSTVSAEWRLPEGTKATAASRQKASVAAIRAFSDRLFPPNLLGNDTQRIALFVFAVLVLAGVDEREALSFLLSEDDGGRPVAPNLGPGVLAKPRVCVPRPLAEEPSNPQPQLDPGMGSLVTDEVRAGLKAAYRFYIRKYLRPIGPKGADEISRGEEELPREFLFSIKGIRSLGRGRPPKIAASPEEAIQLSAWRVGRRVCRALKQALPRPKREKPLAPDDSYRLDRLNTCFRFIAKPFTSKRPT